MRRHRSSKAWQRQSPNPETDPTRILQENRTRELRDLDTCRRVWEQEQDPLALCEAVRRSDLPEWLSHALLVMLTDGEVGYPELRRRMWRARRRHAEDWARVSAMASARAPSEGMTWDLSARVGDVRAREVYGDVAAVSPEGMKRAYQRVCRGLAHPGRYYRAREGMHERIRAAWAYMLGLMKASLNDSKSGD